MASSAAHLPELWAVLERYVHRSRDTEVRVISVHPSYGLADDWARWHCREAYGEVLDVSAHPEVRERVRTLGVYGWDLFGPTSRVFYAECLPELESLPPPFVPETPEERLRDNLEGA
jgi:hypothetical protein